MLCPVHGTHACLVPMHAWYSPCLLGTHAGGARHTSAVLRRARHRSGLLPRLALRPGQARRGRGTATSNIGPVLTCFPPLQLYATHAHHAVSATCSTKCPCWSGAERCLQSNALPDSRMSLGARRWPGVGARRGGLDHDGGPAARYNDFDIHLTQLSSLASTNAISAVPCPVVCITLPDAVVLTGARSALCRVHVAAPGPTAAGLLVDWSGSSTAPHWVAAALFGAACTVARTARAANAAKLKGD